MMGAYEPESVGQGRSKQGRDGSGRSMLGGAGAGRMGQVAGGPSRADSDQWT